MIPHNVRPKKKTVRVILAVKNFAAIPGVCHIGLGVTATNTMKVLRRAGYFCEAWAIQKTHELHDKLVKAENDSQLITHVIVSAPWINAVRFKQFCLEFPNIEFVLLNHSGCAFLSIDKHGIQTNRDCLDLELHVHNFRVAGNNIRFVNWVTRAFGVPCLHLPNLYDTESFINPYPRRGITNPLRLGSFGAGRIWKNQLTAAEAAVEIGRALGVDIELYVNAKRPDGGERTIEARKELFTNLRGCKLIEVPWEPWSRFRSTMGLMNLGLQPSFDETFNVVTADGIAVGVPSVTSSSIEWTPRQWWSNTPEDPTDIMKTALYLLQDSFSVDEGRENLKQYVKNGLRLWKKYLVKNDENQS